MRHAIATLSLVAFAAVAAPALAQSGAAVVGKGPGVAGVAETVKMTATITAIDTAARTVTLKGPQGREVTVAVGPEVKNFAQMKVGDLVNVDYVEAFTVELKKGSTAPVAVTQQAGAAGAKPGERPAGTVGRKVTIVAEVVDLDSATQRVTLRGPERTVDVKVKDREQFQRIAKGDRVEATYTEAVAVGVQPAKK